MVRGRLLAFTLVAVAAGWWLLEGAAEAALPALRAARAGRVGLQDAPAWLVSAEGAFDSGFYLADPAMLWRPRPGYVDDDGPSPLWGGETLKVTGLGLRGAEPAAGTRRVVVLGGSHPFGMWVRAADAYAGLLDAALRPRGWSVLNAACPGHTTWQGLRMLEARGDVLRPDLVIFDLGMNDGLPLGVDWAAPDRAVAAVPPWARASRGLLAQSAVYRALRLGLAPLTSPAPGSVRVPPQDRAWVLEQLRRWQGRTGIPVLAMSQVGIALGPGEGVPVGAARCVWDAAEWSPRVDVCGLFVPLGTDARRYFVDAMHATAEGHLRIADEVLRTLDATGWLDTAPGRRGSGGGGASRTER